MRQAYIIKNFPTLTNILKKYLQSKIKEKNKTK